MARRQARDLALRQVGHFVVPEPPGVVVDGPDLFAPAAAQNVGLALHELGANAVQHGALSQREGKVSLRWQLEERVPTSRGSI